MGFCPKGFKVFLNENRSALFWIGFLATWRRGFLFSLGMRPKPRTLAVLLLGLAGILIGVTFKLNHLMGAHTLFNAGVVVTVVGVVFWIVQLVRGKGG